jgi:hypothetical protein
MESVKRVPDNIIVVKTSKTKYRIAIKRNDGNGFSHINPEPWGLTSVRSYEFLTDPLTFGELHRLLAVYSCHEPTEEWKP